MKDLVLIPGTSCRVKHISLWNKATQWEEVAETTRRADSFLFAIGK